MLLRWILLLLLVPATPLAVEGLRVLLLPPLALSLRLWPVCV